MGVQKDVALSPCRGIVMTIFWLQQTGEEVPAHNDWLCATESLRLQDMRFAKRRADWRLGRWTAKCAVVMYLGRPVETEFLSRIEIRQSFSGAPQVVLGGDPTVPSISLSHRAGTAMCAVGAPGIALGCDLETIEPRSDAFLADYFTFEEQRLVDHAPAADQAALMALLWSAKESALKALLQGLRLDTRSLNVKIVNGERISSDSLPMAPGVIAHPSKTSIRACCQDVWSGLRVHNADRDGTLHGWWKRTEKLVWTLVAELPLLPPVLLDHIYNPVV